VATCAESVGVGSYYVTYRANTRQIFKNAAGADSIVVYATLDSMTYSNGTGKCTANCNRDSTLVKVTSFSAVGPVTGSVEVVVPSGSIVEGHLYGTGSIAGTAQFTAVWTTATGAIRGDSVTVTTTPAAKFVLDIPKRTL
jgi:hypothetical protein